MKSYLVVFDEGYYGTVRAKSRPDAIRRAIKYFAEDNIVVTNGKAEVF